MTRSLPFSRSLGKGGGAGGGASPPFLPMLKDWADLTLRRVPGGLKVPKGRTENPDEHTCRRPHVISFRCLGAGER